MHEGRFVFAQLMDFFPSASSSNAWIDIEAAIASVSSHAGISFWP